MDIWNYWNWGLAPTSKQIRQISIFDNIRLYREHDDPDKDYNTQNRY